MPILTSTPPMVLSTSANLERDSIMLDGPPQVVRRDELVQPYTTRRTESPGRAILAHTHKVTDEPIGGLIDRSPPGLLGVRHLVEAEVRGQRLAHLLQRHQDRIGPVRTPLEAAGIPAAVDQVGTSRFLERTREARQRVGVAAGL